MDGLAYYLIPDFSKFSPELIISALGQTFFTLSLAMGIMVTYGSYLQKSTKLTSSVSQIAGTTFGVSLLAGLMIVPATFAALGSGDAVAQNSGPSLMFIILPQVFENLGGAATIIGVVFFVLVLFAALTSSLSLVETCTSIISDGAGWQALAYRDYRVRDAHGRAREPGLQLAVVHSADGRGLEHPRFARLHLQLGDDAYRCASYLRFRGLDYQAPNAHRRGARVGSFPSGQCVVGRY